MEKNFLTINNFSFEESIELHMNFILSNRCYAIPAQKIIEIIKLPALNILERMPEHIIGLLNLRGKIISVVDLRKILGIPRSSYSVDSQVLIINVDSKTLGIIVDSVNDVVQFNRSSLEPLPYNSEEKHILGVYKNAENLVALLDLDLVMQDIEAIHSEKFDLHVSDVIPSDLFPTDAASVEKFKKRALSLQKELKVDVDRNNYQENRFVSFTLNNEKYCISLKYVKEFCKLKIVSLTTVPCVPSFIMGIINLRGEFITIIDIKSFLQIQETKITEKTKIIVVKHSDIQVGLVVDEVFDIVNIPAEKLNLNPPAKYDKNVYTSAEIILEDGGIMSVLDLKKFLNDESLIVEDAI